ncbi:MAG: glycosyltransferase family 2 protein [Chloroflexales bacterium]|nr:glycosyltransferase family 2 protein [Chloroflexales bacterium]
MYVDVRAAWGASDNKVSPIGTFVDDFETSRSLYTASLIGEVELGDETVFQPAVSLRYISDRQEQYTDSFSVIIPALDEEVVIQACVAAVRALDPEVEIIVADGGSADRTAELAAAAGAIVVRAPRGRGPQCNAGAARAGGEVLIFLHADTTLPAEAFPLLRELFADPAAQVAKFRHSFDVGDPLLALASRLMWVDTRLTSYGDQGIVIRRALFAELGGFPDWPLFEDVRLFELARARAEVLVIPATVTTSARRFQANGALPQLLIDLGLWVEYVAGISPHEIAARYRQIR